MEIIIGKRLKELRRERGATQEMLAEHLAISPQAISKWEREEGYPDITLLPAIASFLDVSVDDLLGVGEIRKREKIEEYRKNAQKLEHVGRWDEAVEVMREAQSEFPNDMMVLKDLMIAISNSDISDSQQQVIPLCKRLLEESNDSEIRAVALAHLCYAYHNLGDMENGKKYAETAPPLYFCKEGLIPLFLTGDELRDAAVLGILECYDTIWSMVSSLISVNGYWGDACIGIAEAFMKITDALFDDGFCGFYHDRARHMTLLLARLYAKKDDEENARKYLCAAAEHSEKYDDLPDMITYTATLLNGYQQDLTKTTGPEPSNMSSRLIRAINEWNSVFGKYSEREWYKEIVSRLEARA